MAPKTYKDKNDGHISDYFSKESLHAKKEASASIKEVGKEKEKEKESNEEEEEWFIDDEYLKDNSKDIEVKLDEGFVSSAS